METFRRTLRNLPKYQWEDVVKTFVELKPCYTESCDYGYKIDFVSETITFYPKHGETMHYVEEICDFAKYWNANIYCDVEDGKAVLKVF